MRNHAQFTVLVKSVAAATLWLAVSACAVEHPRHWGYEGGAGPEHWATLSPGYAACAAGREQSPVDLRDAERIPSGAFGLEYGGRTTEILDNGHAIQVNVGDGNELVAGRERWTLAQMHFHSPSEHRIHGEAFPLEAHLVHTNASGSLAVLGVLFREGDADPALAQLLPHLPARAGERRPLVLPLEALSVLPGDLSRFEYSGSLTTPPCSEGVSWHVFQTLKTASAEQLDAIARAGHGNARPVQPLNGRAVTLTTN